ncbi:STAS/SEC14 domain-containing protein [Thiolapillus sp.]
MPAVFESVLDGTLVFRVSGKLHADDFVAAWHAGEEQIREAGSIRILVIYDGFEGWDDDLIGEVMNPGFMEEQDDLIEKIAVVGEERWREPTELFMLKGLRKAAVEYFEPDQEALARAWLDT